MAQLETVQQNTVKYVTYEIQRTQQHHDADAPDMAISPEEITRK